MSRLSITPRALAAMLVVCACDERAFDVDAGSDAGPRFDAGTGGSFDLAVRTSHSSTLAIGRDGLYRVAVNPDLSGVAVDRLGARFVPIFSDVAPQPSSVALDNLTDSAYVTLRKTRELVRVGPLLTGATTNFRTEVCSEPTGVALTPHGKLAVVACFGEPVAVIVDLQTLEKRYVPLDGVARAVAITNDGDADDLDEHAYVTLFYGAPVIEGSDVGRVGKVAELDLRQGLVSATITLNPIADTGFGPPLADGGEGAHVACSPNQLAAIAIAGTRAFVTYTCVSPQPPLNKLTTLFSAISELDLAQRRETRAVSLAKLVREQGGPGDSLLGLTVDLDVDPTGQLLAVLSQAANRVVMVNVAPGQPMGLVPLGMGSSTPIGIDGAGGSCTYPTCVGGPDGGGDASGVPIGIGMLPGGAVVVNDWTGRAIVDVLPRFARVQYQSGPPIGTREHDVLLGRRFFYTGQDRWSFRDVGSCASCHPDGLSDNVTWVFGTGPRQTPSLDGTFAKGDPRDHRAQNWTAIFDEIYDVEGVTRNLLGGKGAICRGPAPMDTPIPLNLALDFGLPGVLTRNDNLSGSAKWVSDSYSSVGDWRQLEVFVQEVHANRAPVRIDSASVQRGREIFQLSGCASCHGGPKWTVSRVPYDPSPLKNGSAVGDNGAEPTVATGLRIELRDGGELPAFNRDTFKVAPERFTNPDGGAPFSIGPERITCVLRDVGTYDFADPLEKTTGGSRAQGAMGFNPPSLLGLVSSAPYFHSGAARTLSEVFAAKFWAHAAAGGGPAFQPQGQELTDLVEFLRSIDESTPIFPTSMTVDICGGY